jgi:hypothetical protein
MAMIVILSAIDFRQQYILFNFFYRKHARIFYKPGICVFFARYSPNPLLASVTAYVPRILLAPLITIGGWGALLS